MPVKHADVISIEITNEEYRDFIVPNAKKSLLNGNSNVRDPFLPGAEIQRLKDQITGQVAHMAGAIALFGSPYEYHRARGIANANQMIGEGESDVVGSNIDFKGSRMCGLTSDPLEYHLPVRPNELRDHIKYYSILVEVPEPSSDGEVAPVAYVVGYEFGSIVRKAHRAIPGFGDAHMIKNCDLQPIPQNLNNARIKRRKCHTSITMSEIDSIKKRFLSY